MRLYEFITTMQLNENFIVAQREFSKSAPELEVKELLRKFRELGKNGAINDPAQRKIDYWIEQGYENFQLFIDTVGELITIRTNQSRQLKAEEISNDSVCVFSNNTCDAYVPVSHSASRRLGQGSNWCTSASTPGMWNSYVNQQKHIMFKVISKTNTADNFALRYDRNGKVQEIRDLTQQLPRHDLQYCAREFTRHTGLSVNGLWVAAQDKINAICTAIDGKEQANRTDNIDITLYDDDEYSVSANDVRLGGRFLHSLMNLIQEKARGPEEQMDAGEEVEIGLGLAQYINASPLKSQLVRLIDQHWKYVVLHSGRYKKENTQPVANELLKTGSVVLRKYAEVLLGTPSEEKEKELLSIKNKSRRLLLLQEYCMHCTSPQNPASKEIVRVFMDAIRENGSSLRDLNYPMLFDNLLWATSVIYPEYETWLLDACRVCPEADVSAVIDYTSNRQAVTRKPWTEMYKVMSERANSMSIDYFSGLLYHDKFKDDELVTSLLSKAENSMQ